MNKDLIRTTQLCRYYSLKQNHPDAILLFRVCECYEAYCLDAFDSHEIIKAKLSSVDCGNGEKVSVLSFPKEKLTEHLPKLIRAGKRVAFVED